MSKIVFIGAGKMAEAIISRLGSPQNIIASDINRKRLKYLKKKYRIKIAKNNLEAASAADIIILAVKPQNMAKVLAQFRTRKLVISIAAGIPLAYLQKKLPKARIIRAMPNNPCLVGMGITALAKGKLVSGSLYTKAHRIFEAVGEVISVSEKWMDAVTGLSGSGPAYIYQGIEALTEGGVRVGLTKNVAAKLALQTVLGAAATVKETGKSPGELVKMVASPGGTTVEGLKVLAKAKFKPALISAVKAGTKKSKLLSRRWTR